MYNFDKKELTKEKKLFDVFKLSLNIEASIFQKSFISIIFFILYLNACFLEDDLGVLLKTVRDWSNIGFSFSITTLGFLITGFAIFTTVSKPDMMLAMMGHYKKKYKMSTLKYILITFMKVFIGFLVVSFLYIFVIILGKENGFISNLFSYYEVNEIYKCIVIKIAYILIGTSFIYLLFLLKSFIFNIYATVMMFLRWECVLIDKNNLKERKNEKIKNKEKLLLQKEKIKYRKKLRV